MSDQPVAKASTYTGQHNTETQGQTSIPLSEFEPTIPVIKRPIPTPYTARPPGPALLFYIVRNIDPVRAANIYTIYYRQLCQDYNVKSCYCCCPPTSLRICHVVINCCRKLKLMSLG
jgi:hypothetical protein